MPDNKDEKFRKVGMVLDLYDPSAQGYKYGHIPLTKSFITASLQLSFQLHSFPSQPS
jgi:hypothetical protein